MPPGAASVAAAATHPAASLHADSRLGRDLVMAVVYPHTLFIHPVPAHLDDEKRGHNPQVIARIYDKAPGQATQVQI